MALKLFMVLLGCRPKGRHTEQHDIYFGIANSLKELVPEFIQFWPEAKGNMHVDGWREVTQVDGNKISVIPREEKNSDTNQLFFINLGGYKENEFDEFHYKVLVAATDKAKAISVSKQTAFFKHTHFKGANSHIDDKYGVDVDDIYSINEILIPAAKEKYTIQLSLSKSTDEDLLHLGYFKLADL